METSQAGVHRFCSQRPRAPGDSNAARPLRPIVAKKEKDRTILIGTISLDPAALSLSFEGTSCRRCRSEPPRLRRRARARGCALVHKGESFTRAARAAAPKRRDSDLTRRGPSNASCTARPLPLLSPRRIGTVYDGR
ncbi:hypothetical protein MRX96_030280 [Rhipicephalus microplus]